MTDAATKALFFCQVEPCVEQGTSFTSKTGFIQHLEIMHTEIKAWQCSYCDHRCKLSYIIMEHLTFCPYVGVNAFDKS